MVLQYFKYRLKRFCQQIKEGSLRKVIRLFIREFPKKSEEINFRDSNSADISGALFIFKIQYEFTQTQCEEGARDVNNIWVPVVTLCAEQYFTTFSKLY